MKKFLTILFSIIAITSLAQTKIYRPYKVGEFGGEPITSGVIPGLDYAYASTETDGLSFENLEDGDWVDGYTGTNRTVYIPRFRKDGREIKGIYSSITGFENVTNIVFGGESIEVRDVEFGNGIDDDEDGEIDEYGIDEDGDGDIDYYDDDIDDDVFDDFTDDDF